MKNRALFIAGACALAACATAAYSKPFEPMTTQPDDIFDWLTDVHEATLGETVIARLFVGYSVAEPDQYSYLQLTLVNDVPGVDSVEVYDLEANLGKELEVTEFAAVDATTLKIVSGGETILIKVDGLTAAAK